MDDILLGCLRVLEPRVADDGGFVDPTEFSIVIVIASIGSIVVGRCCGPSKAEWKVGVSSPPGKQVGEEDDDRDEQ